jgi:hypothetical protein
MVQQSKSISLWVAAFMFLLHSFVPHLHHGEISEAMHEQEHQSTHWLDFLRTVFHNELDHEAHLEHVELSKTPVKAAKFLEFRTSPDHLLFAGGDLQNPENWQIAIPKFRYRLPVFDEGAVVYIRPFWGYRTPEKALTAYVFSNKGLRAPPAQA